MVIGRKFAMRVALFVVFAVEDYVCNTYTCVYFVLHGGAVLNLVMNTVVEWQKLYLMKPY